MDVNRRKSAPKCARCRNHGIEVPIKNHKLDCPYKDCPCEKCELVEQRRAVMARQTKIRRRDDYLRSLRTASGTGSEDSSASALSDAQQTTPVSSTDTAGRLEGLPLGMGQEDSRGSSDDNGRTPSIKEIMEMVTHISERLGKLEEEFQSLLPDTYMDQDRADSAAVVGGPEPAYGSTEPINLSSRRRRRRFPSDVTSSSSPSPQPLPLVMDGGPAVPGQRLNNAAVAQRPQQWSPSPPPPQPVGVDQPQDRRETVPQTWYPIPPPPSSSPAPPTWIGIPGNRGSPFPIATTSSGLYIRGSAGPYRGREPYDLPYTATRASNF